MDVHPSCCLASRVELLVLAVTNFVFLCCLLKLLNAFVCYERKNCAALTVSKLHNSSDSTVNGSLSSCHALDRVSDKTISFPFLY